MEEGDSLGWDPARLATRAVEDAEAAHRLAVLTLMGLGVPFDPARGLELLASAARQGQATAAATLRLIQTAPGGPAGWLRPQQPEIVSARPHVLIARNFLSPPACDWIRDRAEGRMEAARVYDPLTGEGRIDPIRTNSAAVLDLEQADAVLALVREKISRLAGLPVAGMEPPQAMRYAVGQAFDWHVDYLSADEPGHVDDLARRGQRIATCLVWLSDDHEGGETAFAHGDLRVRGRKGDAVLWANVTPDGRPDPLSRHAGLPPTSGEKWVLSQWMRARPVG